MRRRARGVGDLERARAQQDRLVDLVEREHVRAASGWLDAFLDHLEDAVNDLEGAAWT
jgi:hypothetical protein